MIATWTVWVGGVEVNDHYLTHEEATELANQYRRDGYDDILVEDTAELPWWDKE